MKKKELKKIEAGAPNPAGFVPEDPNIPNSGGTGGTGGDDEPSCPMAAARVQCNNLIFALNKLADAKGVAGCPDDEERTRLSALAGQIAEALKEK